MIDRDGTQCVIGGSTRLYAIIGDPIEQVKSPAIFNPRFAKARKNAVLVPCLVRADSFEQTVRGLMAIGNLDGLIVTVPYKAKALSLADMLGTDARLAGAVNALRREADGRWVGDMFDGKGLVFGLKKRGVSLAGKHAGLLGAGGAGSAVAVAFAQAGIASITLRDLDANKAHSLADRVQGNFPACGVTVASPDLAHVDILINATPVGMRLEDPMPIALPRLRSSLVVIDIIMKPETTPLLALARSSGCRTFGGRVMLEGQADEVMAFFEMEESFGKPNIS
jgi:shikimate dehydrogenase